MSSTAPATGYCCPHPGCNFVAKSEISLRNHHPRCKARLSAETTALREKVKRRKLQQARKQGCASVESSFSQATSRTQIRRDNARKQELAVSYSGLPLHAALSLSERVAAVAAEEASGRTDFDCGSDGGFDIDPEGASEPETNIEYDGEEEESSIDDGGFGGGDGYYSEEETDLDDDEGDCLDSDEETLAPDIEKMKEDYQRADGYVNYFSDFQEPFQYDDDLPIYHVAQISLMKILNDHRKTDLCLFDRIMKWVCHFSDNHPDIWKNRKLRKYHTRDQLMRFLPARFKMRNPYPEKKTIELSDKSKVIVPVYDFDEQVKSIMEDETIMNRDNLIDQHFDKDTLRPTKSWDQLADDDIISDLNTGRLYMEGIRAYCDGPKPPDIDLVIGGPLVIFTDEAVYDSSGGCKTGPTTFTFAFFKDTIRSKLEANRHLGFSPSLSVGRGSNSGNIDEDEEITGKSKKKKGKKKSKQLMKVEDRQLVIRTILESLRKCIERGGVRFMYEGKRALLKPFILVVMGDAVEFNSICGHYNASGCRGVNAICKDCKCSYEQLVSTCPKCEPITLKDLDKAKTDPDYARAISQHQVDVEYNKIPTADLKEGIAGCTPLECLHVLCAGIYKDVADAVHDTIGVNSSRSKDKERLDLLFNYVSHDAGRNCERRIPKYSNRFGFNDRTRLTGKERRGNCYILAIALSTFR